MIFFIQFFNSLFSNGNSLNRYKIWKKNRNKINARDGAVQIHAAARRSLFFSSLIRQNGTGGNWRQISSNVEQNDEDRLAPGALNNSHHGQTIIVAYRLSIVLPAVWKMLTVLKMMALIPDFRPSASIILLCSINIFSSRAKLGKYNINTLNYYYDFRVHCSINLLAAHFF